MFRFYPSVLPLEIKSIKFLFILFVCLFTLFNVFQGIFRGLGKFIQWAFIEGSNDLLARILIILTLVTISREYYVALYCFSGVMLALIFYSLSVTKDQFRLNNLKIEPQVVRFAMMMLLGAIVFMVGTSADAILLRALLKDQAEVGYYFAGVRLPQTLLGLLIAPLSTPFIYYFNHPDTSHTREQIINLGTKLLGISCGILALTFFSLGKIMITVFYGLPYSHSIPVLRTYGFVFFLIGIQSLFAPYLMAVNKLHIQVWFGVFSCSLLVGLDFLFIPLWKSFGAALSNVVMLSVQTLSFVFIISRWQPRIMRPSLLLFLGVFLSALFEIFCIPFSSVPFFLAFAAAGRLFSKEELGKIKTVIFSKVESGAPA